jgi:membrane associated rhomboid family serine protease
MPRSGASTLSFPAFYGFTRRLILVNLAAYFVLLVSLTVAHKTAMSWAMALGFTPSLFLHGGLWQPITYSFVHFGILNTALELLSLWCMAGILEGMHSSNWVAWLYSVSVVGTAAAATAIYGVADGIKLPLAEGRIFGCGGGIFGLLIAIGVLHGDMEFILFPLPISIKARYLAAIYALISFAKLFYDGQRMYAFAELGGALAGLVFIRLAPRRGFSFLFSEQWFALRNRYYRYKRRRAARKFEVYMKSQGRTVRFDGQGHKLDEDSDDKKRWN